MKELPVTFVSCENLLLKFPCPYCFILPPEGMEKHLKQYHKVEKILKCDSCGSIYFATESEKMHHVAKMHSV
ncbi:Hypothetical predicted protein [Cloeon dipterum]|uniref:C2H2-type domain-containing protein n=1 Tax=Cloeon dipterum TaxID=197152 RepID=A0A8S1CQR3_9INSE|nr:Hypothetical predicted protein [Cloeon dipterum]